MRVIEIHISGTVPGDDDELGHEGVYVTRDSVREIAEHLEQLGFVDVKQSRRVVLSKRQRPAGEVAANA